MAFNLGDVFVTFKAKTEELQAGISKVKSMTADVSNSVNKTSFKEFSSKASSAFGSVADSIQRVATGFAIFLTSSSVGLGMFVKSAAGLQQTSKSFEVLTGNVEVANGLFAQLAQYANNTPFEFPQIAKAGQLLLGFGIKSDKVFENVQMLGDIAAATGADFESLALVFGQVNATGRLMGQDSLQLINNKIPITTVLAKKLGVSVQEVKSRMEDGKISAELFNQALLETTQEGGFAFKGTEMLAQTLNGRLSTLKDTVLEFGRNLLGVKVDPKLGLVIKPGGLFDVLSNLLPKITKWLQEMAPTFANAFDFLMRNGDTIISVIAGIAAAFVAAKVAAGIFAAVAAYNPYTLIAAAIVVLIGALVALQIRFDWIGKAITFLKPYVDSLIGIMVNSFIPSLKAVGNTVMDKLLPALSQMWDSLVRLWNAINPALTVGLEWLAKLIGVLLVVNVWLAINAWNFAINVLSFMASAISNVINWISNFIGWIGNIPGAASRAYNAVADWFGKIPGKVKEVVDSVVGWFRDMPGQISDGISDVEDKITAPFKTAFNAIARFWNGTVGKLSFQAPDWVPGLGGKGWAMPKLPQLALGTNDWRGGMVRMNEFGPETAVLPRGTRVITAEQTRQNESGGTGNTYVINLQGVLSRSDSELADIMEEAIGALDRKLGGVGRPQLLGGN